jgi:hypothetical protein
MEVWCLTRVSAAVLITAALCACNGQGPPAFENLQATAGSLQGSAQGSVGLGDVKSAIASTMGYSKDALELLASPAHLRIVVSDNMLAHSNQMDRENAANTIMTAAEQAMGSHPQFATVQVISVAIIHTSQMEGADRGSHTEDVLEFRRGPNQRFAHHIT